MNQCITTLIDLLFSLVTL